MNVEAENEEVLPQAKECLGQQELEETRKDSPLEISKRVWPCRELHFRLLASRVMREYISLLSHLIC